MKLHTFSLSHHRLALVLSTVVLAIFIGGGAWYAEQEPALSLRGLRALFERPLYALEFATLDTRASTGSARAIPVLTYHRIVSDGSDVANTTRSRFKDQMAALKRAGWETVTLEEFESFMRGERTLPDKSFLLTFDDAAKDSFYPVDPILEALGYEAVNFVIVESSNIPRTVYYLNPKEIKRMIESGRWSIGSHSYDGHRPYPVDASGQTGIFFADRLFRESEERLESNTEFRERVHADLVLAKEELEKTYGVPINSFAFPLGNETGINGANNFPEGSAITEEEAKSVYEFGYLQLASQHFTTNLPRVNASSTPPMPSDFLVYRIHVDYDWDGARVLEILENGRAKEIPFNDDFSENRGWINTWGSIDLGRNNFVLRATEDGTSASAFLDGTSLWDDYIFDLSAEWNQGHLIVLADVTEGSTYNACVFSPGVVHIQSTVRGVTETLAEVRDPSIGYGENVRAGVRVHGAVIECAWDFNSIAEAYSRPFSGGIGIQTWDENEGAAELRVSEVIVRPYATSTNN